MVCMHLIQGKPLEVNRKGTYTAVISLCVLVLCVKCIRAGSLRHLLIPIVITVSSCPHGDQSELLILHAVMLH